MPAPVIAPPQAQLLDPFSGTGQSLTPSNGCKFASEEACRLLQCNRLQILYLTSELILVLDEESKTKSPTTSLLNLLATKIYYTYQPSASGFDYIAGRAIFCHASQFVK